MSPHARLCTLADARNAPPPAEIEALADILNLAADLSYCTVCSCIQAQHRVELNVRDGKWQPLNPNGAAARIHQAPPQQQYMAK